MQLYSDIVPTDIRIKNHSELDDNHGFLVRLEQADGKPISFQTPKLSLSWAARAKTVGSKPKTEGADLDTSANLALSLGGNDPETVKFVQWLKAIDTHLVKLITEQYEKITGDELSEAEVKIFLKSLIKPPPKKTAYAATYLPRLAHKKIGGDLKITVKTFSPSKKELVPEEALPRGAQVLAICTIAYVHISKGTNTFNVRSDVNQILVVSKPVSEQFGFDLAAHPEVVEQAAKEEEEGEEVASSSGGGSGTKRPLQDEMLFTMPDKKSIKMSAEDDEDDV